MLIPTQKKLFFSKNDPSDIRIGDLASIELNSNLNNKNNYAIIGYPDDEGIQLNAGRIGAKEGPESIRFFLYKMTPPYYFAENTQFNIKDIGDIDSALSLELKHVTANTKVTELLQQNFKVISFGGGHDYGFPDAKAFCEFHLLKNPSLQPIILNFDAHLDVRPNDLSNHSGTPFYRLMNEFQDKIQIIEIGTQTQCNSKNHWNWALKNKIEIHSLKELESSHWQCLTKSKTIENIKPNQPVFISFDIDGLRNSDAGGCSQSWPTGLKIKDCLAFLNLIYQKSSCTGLGIYEVAPKFDFDFRTSKAAALIAYDFIFQSERESKVGLLRKDLLL